MKKMKFTALFLIFTLCFSACGRKSQEPTPNTAAPMSEITASPEPAAEPTPKPTPEDPISMSFLNDVSYYGKLRVEGTQLMDSLGNAVQLRGLSSHGLSWFPEFVNEENFGQMKSEWGCNVFRLAMYTDEENGYCTGDPDNREELKKLIDYTVKKCESLGMYVIIDWHILFDSSPMIHKDEALAFFAEMSKKYADYDNVLYEICNEPNGAVTWEEVKAYAEEVVPVIRENTDAVILIGTPTWSQDIHLAVENPVMGFENIMYTLHFYAASHGDFLRERLVDALAAGLPIFVSEYGICDASGNGDIDEGQADKWIDLLDVTGVSHVMWNLSNKDESSAMIDSFCDKVSGFELSDLSQAGKWFVSRVSGGPGSRPGMDQSSGMGKSEVEGDLLKVSLKDFWESGGNIFYQYSVSVKNQGSSASGWSVEIEFGQTVALRDSWNGKFDLEGSILTITPEDYNDEIASGSYVSDVGFIIEAGSGLDIRKAEVQVG